MTEWIEWIQADKERLLWLAGFSVVTFVGTLLAVPWLVVRIPSDYFINTKRHRLPWAELHPVLRIVLLVIKNVIGLLFIMLGISMLVLPGQGALTILLGVMLLNFPGKFRLEKWIATRKPIRHSIAWLRERAGRPPLILHDESEST